MFRAVCLFIKIFTKISKISFVMIKKSNSITDILDSIISKIETELEQNSLHVHQSGFEDVTISEKRNRLSCDSVEDVNCRICYDHNQELSIMYPCKCKVRENRV